MKKIAGRKSTLTLTVVCAVLFAGSFMISCEKNSGDTEPGKTSYFLSEIRPVFFEQLNFESAAVRDNIAAFKEKFYQTFNKAEQEYQAGHYKSESDIEFFRLESQYYGFYLLALTGAYLDGYISFQQIHGNSTEGRYSNLPASTPDFEYLEMRAMIDRGKDLMYRAAWLGNKYNDKVYAFYLGVNQLAGRLKSRKNLNDPEAHRQVIDFSDVRLTNYNLVPTWNLLMAQVTLTNYNDSLNTFANPHLNVLFKNVQERLVPGSLRDLGGKYPEILGPLYRFDLTMKKIDWYLKKNDLTGEELAEINQYLTAMQTVMQFIETKKTALLNSWIDKDTYELRKEKWQELRNYFDDRSIAKKPELSSFINSKKFIRAYQCYSCHRESGL